MSARTSGPRSSPLSMPPQCRRPRPRAGLTLSWPSRGAGAQPNGAGVAGEAVACQCEQLRNSDSRDPDDLAAGLDDGKRPAQPPPNLAIPEEVLERLRPA